MKIFGALCLAALYIAQIDAGAVVGEKEKVSLKPFFHEKAKNTSNRKGTATYEAPSGTAIVDWEAHKFVSYGHTSYSFETIGDSSLTLSDSSFNEKWQQLYDYADQHVTGDLKTEYKKRLNELKNTARQYSTVSYHSNSKLLCHWKVAGKGPLSGGGSLGLDLDINLVKVLTRSNMDGVISHLIDAMAASKPAQELSLTL